MKYDYLIVGAGLFGAVFAHEAKKSGKKCLVIEKRNHIAGNIYWIISISLQNLIIISIRRLLFTKMNFIICRLI